MNFKQFYESMEKPSLILMDIDNTLFMTKAQINVLDSDGNIVTSLDNEKFNRYKLQSGESFDFGQLPLFL